MLTVHDVRKGLRLAGLTIWAALAIWGMMTLTVGYFGRVVVAMSPKQGSWCRGVDFLQAEFHGYKIRPLWPVAGSVSGQTKSGARIEDVPFYFADDATPDSSKPLGWVDFGRWRWVSVKLPDAVRITIRHTDGIAEIQSTFGFFPVPRNIPICGDGE